MDLDAVKERAGPGSSARRPSVVPHPEVGEVSADEAEFGGTTDKSYPWATAYKSVDADFVREVADSQKERETAKAQRGDA